MVQDIEYCRSRTDMYIYPRLWRFGKEEAGRRFLCGRLNFDEVYGVLRSKQAARVQLATKLLQNLALDSRAGRPGAPHKNEMDNLSSNVMIRGKKKEHSGNKQKQSKRNKER
jgi:hypothetical protein